MSRKLSKADLHLAFDRYLDTLLEFHYISLFDNCRDGEPCIIRYPDKDFDIEMYFNNSNLIAIKASGMFDLGKRMNDGTWEPRVVSTNIYLLNYLWENPINTKYLFRAFPGLENKKEMMKNNVIFVDFRRNMGAFEFLRIDV